MGSISPGNGSNDFVKNIPIINKTTKRNIPLNNEITERFENFLSNNLKVIVVAAVAIMINNIIEKYSQFLKI